MSRLILIHPPVTKPGQPPTGIPRLKYVLKKHGISSTSIDANLEGLLYLLDQTTDLPKRASAAPAENLEYLRNGTAFTSINRYTKSIREINRILSSAEKAHGWHISLSDIKHPLFSPVRSQDLINQSIHPEINPFYIYYRDQLIPKIAESNPEVIGLSIVYLSQALCAFALAGMLRQSFPDKKIILGGGLISSWMSNPNWDNPFEELGVDCVRGPGENVLLNLFNKTMKPDLSGVSDFSDFPVDQYLSPGFVLPYSTSSGCYWKKCQFCPETHEDQPFRSIPAEQVGKDLLASIHRTNPALIHLIDNAIPPAALRYFADHPFGVPWYGHVRFEKDLEDPDFCCALHTSGCRMLQLGFESGSQHVLDQMNKGLILENATKILKNLTRAGIGTYVYFLFGTPYETLKEARETIETILKHRDFIQWISPAIFNLSRFSPEAEMLKTRMFYKGDLSLYLDFEHPKGWHRKEVRDFFGKEFKTHPEIKKILRRTPPVFTSNHAPFFENDWQEKKR
jgi:hypothetical protein